MKVSEPVPLPSKLIFAKAARRDCLENPLPGFLTAKQSSVWEIIPAGLRNFYPVRAYGTWLQSLVRLVATREQYLNIFSGTVQRSN